MEGREDLFHSELAPVFLPSLLEIRFFLPLTGLCSFGSQLRDGGGAVLDQLPSTDRKEGRKEGRKEEGDNDELHLAVFVFGFHLGGAVNQDQSHNLQPYGRQSPSE